MTAGHAAVHMISTWLFAPSNAANAGCMCAPLLPCSNTYRPCDVLLVAAASNGQHISTIPPGLQTASLQLPSQRFIGSTIPAPPHHWQASTSSYQTSSTGGTACYDSGSSIVADKGGGVRLLPRIFTFGIGPYCNHYFLKRLAGMSMLSPDGQHSLCCSTLRELRTGALCYTLLGWS